MHSPALRALPTLKETLTIGDYADACNTLGLDPTRTLRNPVAALPLVASCETGLSPDYTYMIRTPVKYCSRLASCPSVSDGIRGP